MHELGHLRDDVKRTWQRFSDVFATLRPELYRYCRHLTHDPWDAEDLVQESLTRAFATLGTRFHDLPNPRAWLFRVASNVFLDRMRRERRAPRVQGAAGIADTDDAQALREAAGTLLVRLSPQERAALVLKDVFDFALDEIASMLATTEGAVKAALHRGRGKLREEGEPDRRVAAPAVLDAFCAAFNARDPVALTALLLDGASVEIVGVVTEYGRDEPNDPYSGSFAGTLAPITHDERGGVPAELLDGYHGAIPRCEVRTYRGVPVLVFWYDHEDAGYVRTVMLLETEGDQVARVRNYFFTPDVIAEVCRELALPFRVNGYRYW